LPLRHRTAADRGDDGGSAGAVHLFDLLMSVQSFYEETPFPGYPSNATLEWLRARAERSEFAQMLDRAIPGDATVLDLGCGTGQMSLYLARADRVVVGADLSLPSLRLAAAAARRFGLDRRVGFIQTDLHRPALPHGAFD